MKISLNLIQFGIGYYIWFMKYICLMAIWSTPVYLEAYETEYSNTFFEKASASQVLDAAVLISLNRFPLRYEITKNFMEQVGFTNTQRFEAIDGQTTSEEFFKNLNIGRMLPGEKGCAASHLLVWNEFVNSSDKDFLFIAEDDMIPHSNFSNLFPFFWNQTPNSFDIVMVGSHLVAEVTEALVLSREAMNTHAYIISRKGARKLLDFYKAQSEGKTIDIFMRNMTLAGNITCYCYNGRKFPDRNQTRNDVYKDGGICYQNLSLGTTIEYGQ